MKTRRFWRTAAELALAALALAALAANIIADRCSRNEAAWAARLERPEMQR
jgi:hypothetical protein